LSGGRWASPPARHYSDVTAGERGVPGELPHAIRVTAGPGEGPAIGAAHLSGFTPSRGGVPEPLWHLFVGRAAVPGRYTLRRGAFVGVDEFGEEVGGDRSA
jgi:hypothetical protein